MRIDQLTLKHFKGFDTREFSFHPEFNLLVGKNGTGKTSALDALAVAIGSWFLGIKGADTRHIRANEVMLGDFEHEDIDDERDSDISVFNGSICTPVKWRLGARWVQFLLY